MANAIYLPIRIEALHPTEAELAARLRVPLGYRDAAIDEIERALEQKLVGDYLSEAVMVPEYRVEVNKKGFCDKHFAMLEAGVAEMDEVAMVAADINGNGVLDIGDAAKICYKAAADWADYIA